MCLRLLFSDFFARKGFIFSVENLEVSHILLERERERERERITTLNTSPLFLYFIIYLTFLIPGSVKNTCTYISHTIIIAGTCARDILFSRYKYKLRPRTFADADIFMSCRAILGAITYTHLKQKLQYLTDREILVVFRKNLFSLAPGRGLGKYRAGIWGIETFAQ